jgi:hypothetical protein
MRNWVMNHPKLSAGVCFGCAGLFTTQIILLTFYRQMYLDLAQDFLPVAAFAICGAWLGGKIICASANRTAIFSVKRGIMVMLLSFLLYCLLISALAAILNKSVTFGLGILFEFTVFGTILFGWLLVLMGAVAGWLLYRVLNQQATPPKADRKMWMILLLSALSVICFAVFIIGSRLLLGDSDDFVLRTDQVHLAAYEETMNKRPRYNFTITARLENRSQSPVYLGRCFPDTPYPFYDISNAVLGVIRHSAYSPAWSCVGHNNPIIVQPGETRIDNFRIIGPSVWISDIDGERYDGELEGRFSLGYHLRFCPEEPCLHPDCKAPPCKRPDVYLRSNVFTIYIE